MHSRLQGFTLVEAVIAIVVLAIGVVSMLTVFLVNIRHSADPMVEEQANAVAQSYLEEILLKSFCDQNDFASDCPAACTTSACASCSGGTTDGSTAEDRTTYDDVCDYDGLTNNAGAVDHNGTIIGGLEQYNISVQVDDAATLNGLTAANGQVLKVVVRVTHDSVAGVSVDLEGYRANY